MTNRINIFFTLIAIQLMVVAYATGQVNQKLDPFNKIKTFGKLEIKLSGDSLYYIKINSSEFDVSKVKFEVKDRILDIKLTSEFPTDIKVKVEIGFEKLNSITAGGGIRLFNRDTIHSRLLNIEAKSGSEIDLVIIADSTTAKVNKGAFMRLMGESRVVKLTTSTNGDYRAKDLLVENMAAKMLGGTAEVNVQKYLDVTASFKASLGYVKKPEKITKKEKLGAKVSILEKF